MKKKSLITLLLVFVMCFSLCACGANEEDSFVAPSNLEDACDLADMQVSDLNDGSKFSISGGYDSEEGYYAIVYECVDAHQSSLVYNAYDETAIDGTMGYAYRVVSPYFENVEVPVLVGMFDFDGELLLAYDGNEIIDLR